MKRIVWLLFACAVAAPCAPLRADEFAGTVYVLIRDAGSQKPIDGAKVVFLSEAEVWTPDKEKTGPQGNTGLSDGRGIASARMGLGREVTKVGFLRYQKTRSVVAQAFKLRVEKVGYKTFYGLVHGVFACVSPKAPMRGELLNEVRLMPAGLPGESKEEFIPLQLTDYEADRKWVAAGEKIIVSARLSVPPLIQELWKEANRRFGLGVSASASFLLRRGTLTLSDSGSRGDLARGDHRYSASIQVAKKVRSGLYPIHFKIVTDRSSMILTGDGKLQAGSGVRLGGYPGPVPDILPKPYRLGSSNPGPFVRDATFVAIAPTEEEARGVYEREIRVLESGQASAAAGSAPLTPPIKK